MANITREQAAEAVRQYRLKLERERIFLPSIRSLFNRISNDASNFYAASGNLLDAREFEDEWQNIIRRNANITNQKFTGSTFDPVGLTAILTVALTRLARSQSINSAAAITATNQIDIADSFARADFEVAQQGFILPQRQRNLLVARTGKVNLRTAFNGRARTVASSETQLAAESSKLTEARFYSGEIVIPEQTEVAEKKSIVKKWITVGDDKVRPAHMAVNGITVGSDEFFIVKNEQLRHPGDRQSGASLENVINCRCTALYETK